MSAGALAAMGVCALLVMGCALLLFLQLTQDQKVEDRLRAVRHGGVPRAGATPRGDEISLPARMLSRFGAAVIGSGLLPGKTLSELTDTLNTAGFRGRHALGLFAGGKVALLALLPITAWLLLSWLGFGGMTFLLGVMGAMVGGLLLPDMAVRAMRAQHLKNVERGLADAMDMLVICAEAGLALEPAITRVGREIEPAHPAISQELLQTANEMRIVADYRVAMTQLGQRTNIDGIKRLTTTLLQTLQYGTPLTDALRVLSSEMRAEMMTRFEARAARLPVLLTLPMIVFILPCVFLVVGGPAVIQVIQIFSKG